MSGRYLGWPDVPTETVALARALIGCELELGAQDGVAGRIVETEAYVPEDAASHAYRGETVRNRSMFLRPGHAYVYFIYGTAFCLNVSSEPAGVGAAVLIRALEPSRGLAAMAARRRNAPLRDLCRGPGRLTAALAIDRASDGLDLLAPGPLRLLARTGPPPEIGTSVRIGLSREADRPLRFYERASRYLSGPARLSPAGEAVASPAAK